MVTRRMCHGSQFAVRSSQFAVRSCRSGGTTPRSTQPRYFFNPRAAAVAASLPMSLA